MGGSVHRTAELRAVGYTDGELLRMRRSGALRAVRRGVYAEGAAPGDVAARHLVAVHAAVAELGDGTVVSHTSAAVLHGLPVWNLPLDRVQVTRNRRRSGARRSSCVHVHCAPLAPDEIVVVDGVATTTPARTVVDVARVAPFEQAVVVADAALHAGLAGSTLVEALRRARGWPGIPAARRAAAFADGGSESVGESRSRVAIARTGLPNPALQWPIRLGGADFPALLARADFAWVAQRTVGEFDGKVKYGRLLRPGQEPGEVVHAEKVREDRIRAQGWEVVRWTWADLCDFAPTAARIRGRFRAV